ncbi:MAG: hypothetical protein GXO02_04930 [Epsilonproteobacteria bacterium]|nr:hypothetical protein [Campylobacterota bacterium]
MADLSNDYISHFEDDKAQIELNNEKDKRRFKKIMFYGTAILIVILFIISFYFVYKYLFDTPTNSAILSKKEVEILIKPYSISASLLISITLMIPTILSLAMMRFLFGNSKEKEEKNVPSIIFNIGRELKETIIAFLNKK